MIIEGLQWLAFVPSLEPEARSLLARTAAFVLGCVFVRAAIAKADVDRFVEIAMSWELGPPRIARLSGKVLPLLELAAGAWLLLSVTTPSANPALAFFAAAVVLGLFLVGQLFILGQGKRVACGCFGSSKVEFVGRVTSLRTCACISLAVTGIALAG